MTCRGDGGCLSALPPPNGRGVLTVATHLLGEDLIAEGEHVDRLGDEIAYPYAWSLLYFLIQDTQHQRLVSDYLNTLADHRCKRFDDSAYLDRAYQGGLTSLEQDWKKWLTRDTPVALQF